MPGLDPGIQGPAGTVVESLWITGSSPV